MKAIILDYYHNPRRVVVMPIPEDIDEIEDAYEYVEDCPWYHVEYCHCMIVDDNMCQVDEIVVDEEHPYDITFKQITKI